MAPHSLPIVDLTTEDEQIARGPIFGANSAESNNLSLPPPIFANKTPQNGANTTNGTRYDPAQLLDPKGFKKSHQQNSHQQKPANNLQNSAPVRQTFTFEGPGSSFISSMDGADDSAGMGSMMEKLHGVTNRSAMPPAKRQKLENGQAVAKKPIDLTLGMLHHRYESTGTDFDQTMTMMSLSLAKSKNLPLRMVKMRAGLSAKYAMVRSRAQCCMHTRSQNPM